MTIGHTIWAIAEGYIPSGSVSPNRALVSHEPACILNVTPRDADVKLTLFFSDREPIGPYHTASIAD